MKQLLETGEKKSSGARSDLQFLKNASTFLSKTIESHSETDPFTNIASRFKILQSEIKDDPNFWQNLREVVESAEQN